VSSILGETLIITDGVADEGLLRQAAPSGGQTVVSLSDGLDQLLQLLDARLPALLVLSVAGSSEPLLELVRQARHRHGDVAIVVLHGGSPNGFMERAFQLGADDLITLPQTPEALAFAFEKAMTRRRGSAPAATAPLICIIGPKGGTGKTLTACNLAVALARAGARPAVVDLDLQFGDVGLALGLQPERTIYDLVLSGGALDVETVERFVTRHDSGVDVLLAPVRPDQASAVGIDSLRDIYSSLRARHDFVIVDTPPAFSPEVIAAVDASTALCVVGMLDALSLKDTKIGLETLALMGCDPDDITLVLNRADTSVGISMQDVYRLLGRRPDVLVPSDRAIPRAITDGVPIVAADSKSGAARAFTELAAVYLQAAAPAIDPEMGQRGGRRSILRKGR
jgi:pilus assembly protein CpaE